MLGARQIQGIQFSSGEIQITNDRLLELALKGLKAERAKIDGEISEVGRQLGQKASVEETLIPRKRRKMSAAAKKKISEAMKRSRAERRKKARR